MNLSEEACPMGGPDAHAYRAAANTGLPLADFECRHGKLLHEDCQECRPLERETPAELRGFAEGGTFNGGLSNLTVAQ